MYFFYLFFLFEQREIALTKTQKNSSVDILELDDFHGFKSDYSKVYYCNLVISLIIVLKIGRV